MAWSPTYSRRELLATGGLLIGAHLFGPQIRFAHAADGVIARPVKAVNSAGGLGGVMQTMVKEMGLAEEFGLDIEYLNVADGAKINAGLIGGDGDLCCWSGFSQVLPAIERGAALKILGGCLTVPALGLFSSKPDVRSVKDLVGKSVAAGSPGSLLYTGTVAALRKYGVDEKKVQFVNIGSSQNTFQAMVAGTVDAGIAEVEIMDQQQKYGLHVLDEGRFWDELPQFTWQAAYATEERIKNKRDLLVRVLALNAKLYRFLCGPNSWEAWSHAHQTYFGQSDDPVRTRTFWNFFQQRQPLAVDLVMSEESIRYVQELNLSLGMQQKILPYEQIADMSLAEDALKMLS